MSDDSTRSLGEWLRQRRETLGISLEKAQAETRIRAAYLKALESEDFSVLPDPIVGRGFLRNYATYLGLDPQEAVARFSGKVAPPEKVLLPGDTSNSFRSGPFEPLPLHEMPGFGRRRVWFLGIAVVVVVALAAAAWWSWPWLTSLFSAAQPQPGAAASSVTQQATATLSPPAPTATVPVVIAAVTTEVVSTAAAPSLPSPTQTSTPRPSPTPTVPTCEGICVDLTFTGTSWFQVTIDGIRTESRELTAGNTRSYSATQEIALRIGNGSAVAVTVNGMNLGALGGPAEVVDRVITLLDGQLSGLTPTPTPSRALPQPSATPATTPALPPATAQPSPTAPLSTTLTTPQ